MFEDLVEQYKDQTLTEEEIYSICKNLKDRIDRNVEDDSICNVNIGNLYFLYHFHGRYVTVSQDRYYVEITYYYSDDRLEKRKTDDSSSHHVVTSDFVSDLFDFLGVVFNCILTFIGW